MTHERPVLLGHLAATCGDHAAAARLFDEAARRDEHAGASAFAQRDRRAREQLPPHALTA